MNDPTHVGLPWDDQAYSIKRHGVTLTNCDAEPVQRPGCIQDHGALLVLRPGDLTVAQASENVAAILGVAPEVLLGRDVATVLGEENAARLTALLAKERPERNPVYAFTLPPRADGDPLDVFVHTVDGAVVVEFEATGRADADAPDSYAAVKKAVGRFQSTESLRALCDTVADEVRALTGFDRAMVYRFHADGHGEVFAESRRDDLPPWLGLHYPAEDIPKPAREVFTRTWIRPLPDVSGGLAEMVPLVHPDTGKALEMTQCALRGASVMYTEYLKNMGVTAGLTLALRRGDELWGLIACHHYTGPRHVPYPVRVACELLAQVASLQHRAAEDREHHAYRLRLDAVHQQLVAAAAQEGGLAAMTDGPPTLLDGLDADGFALYHRDRWWRVGATPSEAQLDALAAWLEGLPQFASSPRPLYVTDALARDHAAAAAYADVASGLLAMPLSRSRRNLLLWFRAETLATVSWGGNPHDKPSVPGPHGPRLTPRRSFELFQESVRERSRPWLLVELEAATRLRLQLMELVVARAERLAELNADLARSNEELDAFAYVASHDLKEPLRGIHKYAHQLLEESAADDPKRPRVESLMRLTIRMDSLLDSLLHFSRVGRAALLLEPVDLNELVGEAVEMVGSRRSGDAREISIPRPLPTVWCDRVRVREVLVNLLSNALKYNDRDEKHVEVGYLSPAEARGASAEGADGHTVFFVRDDGIGIHLRHFEQVFKMFKRLHGRDAYGGGTGAGLTIVKKLIERHHGSVWLESTPGAGTTVYFTLPQEERP